jgi:uncharacterized membrane protein
VRAQGPRAIAGRRIALVDAARGVAILAMVVYHFAWDLSLFGYVETDVGRDPAWRAFAAGIAGSFLTLVGVSLVLAHGEAIRWRAFARRWAMVAGAGMLVSLGSWIVFPDRWIYFGILHGIALSSLIGLAFVRAPAWVAAVAAVAVFAAAWLWRGGVFLHPAWLWLGLSIHVPATNDYVPLIPWSGFTLAGVALARIAVDRGLAARLAGLAPGRCGRGLAAAGRNSLVIYLLHQPLLIGLVWLAAQVAPPRVDALSESQFLGDCREACRANGRPEAACTDYCACAAGGLKEAGLFRDAVRARVRAADQPRVAEIVAACTRSSLRR